MPTIYVDRKDKLPKRIRQDVYCTEPRLAESALLYLQEHYSFSDRMSILDPGAGPGVWGKTVFAYMPKAWIIGVELRKLRKPLGYSQWWPSQGYLNWKTSARFSLILGNPPFKYGERFVRKSLRLLRDDGVLCFLLPTHFIHGLNRGRKLFKEHRPDRVISLMQRPEFTGPNGEALGKGTPNTCVLIIWRKQSSRKTEMDWLDWKD